MGINNTGHGRALGDLGSHTSCARVQTQGVFMQLVTRSGTSCHTSVMALVLFGSRVSDSCITVCQNGSMYGVTLAGGGGGLKKK